MTAEPKYATPVNPDRPNLLPEAENLAQLVGLYPLLPWQEHLLALLTEYEEGNPVDGIVPFYNQVVFSIPRQTGKTEVICTCVTCLRFAGLYKSDGEPPFMVYAAQTASDAIAVWETKIAARLLGSDWGREVGFYWTPQPQDPHLRIADAHVRKGRFKNGKMRIIANKSGAGLGLTSDMVILDEARQYGDESREADLVPQMNTRPSPQLIVASTMGGPTSQYFNRKVDAGRAIAEQQAAGQSKHLRRAYVEYGVGDVASDDYDAGDPKVWAAAHPMLGFCNWTLERMGDEYDRCVAEGNVEMFRNNFLNQRLRADDTPAIPTDLLTAAEAERYGPEDLGTWQVIAVSSSPDGRYLSAAVCGADKVRLVRPAYDEKVGDLVRTEKHRVTQWLDDYLEDKPFIRQVRFAADSEMSALLERYRRRGTWVGEVSTRDYKGFCVGLLAGFTNLTLGLERADAFREAVLAAERFEGALGRNWIWRKKPDVDVLIDPLIAVTLAYGAWRVQSARPALRIR